MIKTLQRAVVVTAALFAIGPALAGVAHADPALPDLPTDFEFPCPPEGCQPAPEPPVIEINCPPLCPDDPEVTIPFPFQCPPVCVDPGDDPTEFVPICPPICQGPTDDPTEFVPICPPICPDDGGGDDPGDDPGDNPDDNGDPGDNPGDGGDPGDEPSDDPTPDSGDQPQGSLPKTGGPDLPLLLASGIGLIAAGGFGYLLVARRR